MKTTKEIIGIFEQIGHDPISNEFYLKKWFSEEEIKKAINKKIVFLEYILEKKRNPIDEVVNILGVNVALVSLKELKKELFGDKRS